jgi:hypothetical protein
VLPFNTFNVNVNVIPARRPAVHCRDHPWHKRRAHRLDIECDLPVVTLQCDHGHDPRIADTSLQTETELPRQRVAEHVLSWSRLAAE